jgi:hypothetical protein
MTNEMLDERAEVTPLAVPVFSVFTTIWGPLMSVNRANSLSNGKQVIFLDMIGLTAWPATITAFTKLSTMTVTPTSALGGTPPGPVTFTLSGDGTAALPLYGLN